MAALRPFKRVIGVELSEELNRVARANVERIRGRLRCQDVELVTEDAALYVVPDDVTVAYLFAPFGGKIFHQVLFNLIASVDRRPRSLRLVYNSASEQDALMFSGRARETWSWPARAVSIYSLEPRREER